MPSLQHALSVLAKVFSSLALLQLIIAAIFPSIAHLCVKLHYSLQALPQQHAHDDSLAIRHALMPKSCQDNIFQRLGWICSMTGLVPPSSSMVADGFCPSQDGAEVIPAGADVYAQLVESDFLHDSAVSLQTDVFRIGKGKPHVTCHC